MRADFLLAVLLAGGGVCVGLVMMAVPIVFPSAGRGIHLTCFWGGLVGAVVCFALAGGVAMELRAPGEKTLAVYGMALFGAAFAGSLVLYLRPLPAKARPGTLPITSEPTALRSRVGKEAAKPMEHTKKASVVGLDVTGNHQGAGNAAFEINSTGTPETPSVGADISVHGQPGQSVTGLRINQIGPGTGMRIQNGPGVGMRISVTAGGAPAEKKP